MRLDLHVHSRYSVDSRLSVEAIVSQLGAAGLQGFALTDHNTLAGHRRLAALRPSSPHLLLIPGVEVSTQEGHLLVYGVTELPPVHRPLAETLDWVRVRDGVAVLAHPFRWSHGVGAALAESAPSDGIEVMNGHSGAVANAKAELVAARRHLSATGGSDAHELSGLGRTFTEIREPIETVDELLRALRQGHATAGGVSLSPAGRVRLSARTVVLRALRGFRPI